MKKQAALVVIDVQSAFLGPEPMLTTDGNDLVDKVSGLLERARRAQVPVLYVEHVGFGAERPLEDLLPTHPRIAPRAGEPVTRKLYGDAFVGTSFDAELKSLGIRHLVLCGLATNGCLNAAATHAKALGYDVTVVEDANACVSGDPTGKTAREIIAEFAASWKELGVGLVRSEAVDFTRL